MFEKLSLPELKGSERQIDWAERIREKLMEEAEKEKVDISFFLENEKDSKIYIDNKDFGLLDVAKSYILYAKYFSFELPKLEGSAKQIKWGESIRDGMLAKIRIDSEEEEMEKFAELFKQKVDSIYFITNKDYSYQSLKALAFANIEANKAELLLPALEGEDRKVAKENKKRRNSLEDDYKAFYLRESCLTMEDILEKYIEIV